jgi:hypothetical protein
MGSEEWGNCAFNEGWAQFISASVWNRRGDTDCDYRGTHSWNNCYDPGSAAAAPSVLSGSRLYCFKDVLDSRISR